jgi:hypothetical protein
LPNLDQQNLYDLGQGGNPNVDANAAANLQRIATPITELYCPTRRRPQVLNIATPLTVNGAGTVTQSARTDYAANGGAIYVAFSGPASLQAANTGYTYATPPLNMVGVIVAGNPVPRARVSNGDGDSNTLLFAEKCLARLNYSSGQSLGDDGGPFIADEKDSVRFAANGATPLPPIHDGTAVTWNGQAYVVDPNEPYRFGSAHSSGMQAVFCDAAVRTIRFNVDPIVFAAICTREGREVVDPSSF